MPNVTRDPGAGLCPGGCHAAPASEGYVLPPRSPAASPPVTAHGTGNRVDKATFVNTSHALLSPEHNDL